MECKCNGKFWIGLGLGTVLGVIGYYFAKSDKAKDLRSKVHCAAHSAAQKAGEWMTNVKESNAKVEEENVPK